MVALHEDREGEDQKGDEHGEDREGEDQEGYEYGEDRGGDDRIMHGGEEWELLPIEAAEISSGREVAVRANPVNGQRSASPHLSGCEHVVCPAPRRRSAEEREPTRNPGGLREARFRSKQVPRFDGAGRPVELGKTAGRCAQLTL